MAVLPVPKAYRKWCVKFRTTPSVRTGFPAVIKHRALKMSKIKKLKRSNFGQSVFFREQNALCSKTGGAIIGLRVSKQDGMVFSSSPTCLKWTHLSPLNSDAGIKSYEGKEYWAWNLQGSEKSQIMDVVCWIMISNHPTDVMWLNGHILPQQNHALMKILSEKCRALGLHS